MILTIINTKMIKLRSNAVKLRFLDIHFRSFLNTADDLEKPF